jgi:glycerol-3-phosphate dehydrogenase
MQGPAALAWLLRLGLFLYDHIGGRKLLPATKYARPQRSDAAGKPLEAALRRVPSNIPTAGSNDARLVVLNARDAADSGAIRTRTKVIGARREGGLWS